MIAAHHHARDIGPGGGRLLRTAPAVQCALDQNDPCRRCPWARERRTASSIGWPTVRVRLNACSTPRRSATARASLPSPATRIASAATGRAKRLAQPARRQESRPLQIGSVDDQQIHVARKHANAEIRRQEGGPSRPGAVRRRGRPESGRRETSTAHVGSARASINGSSPARARSARSRVPSLTTVTPSSGSVRA